MTRNGAPHYPARYIASAQRSRAAILLSSTKKRLALLRLAVYVVFAECTKERSTRASHPPPHLTVSAVFSLLATHRHIMRFRVRHTDLTISVHFWQSAPRHHCFMLRRWATGFALSLLIVTCAGWAKVVLDSADLKRKCKCEPQQNRKRSSSRIPKPIFVAITRAA